MKKYIIGGVIVLAIAAYLIFASQKPTTSDSTPDGGTGTSAPSETLNPGSTPSPSPTPTPSSAGSSFKDGSYTGTSETMIYGTVQVKAVIAGGKITDIQFVQFPNAPGHTQEVTAQAEPVLKQEAIESQSAQVNIVSGATQDSQAFQASLASALSQAS